MAVTVQLVPKTVRTLILNLTVPGEPVPWKRPGKDRRSGRSFTPTPMAAQMNLIGLLARGRCQTPTPDPVIVDMDFFLGNNRRADLSNFLKLAEDALNGIAWDDDSQIIEAVIHKHVDKTFPRTEIRVWKVVG